MYLSRIRIALAAAMLALIGGVAVACPFCSAVNVTFSEEMKNNDTAAIVKLVEPAPKHKGEELEFAKATFEVTEVLKGSEHVKIGDRLKTIYIGEAKVGTEFLSMGILPPVLEWGPPIELTDRAKKYLRELMKLPESGVKRLEFFLGHLESADPLISRDAYDEFATTPYDGVKELKPKMDRKHLISRLKDPKTDAAHRRLYFTMLGVCGTKEDLPLLEELLKNDDRDMKTGLDALVACYLTLSGEDGLPLIVEHYLKNEKIEFTDQYQAIQAIRFHGEQGGVIKKEKLAAALRHMLDRPKYADLVVPDLARWQDWSVMDRLYELFRDADAESLWVREPIVNYMKACPLPKAKEYLEEFNKIDPKAVKRAAGYAPVAPKTSPVGDDPKPGAQRPKKAKAEVARSKSPPARTTFKYVSAGQDDSADQTIAVESETEAAAREGETVVDDGKSAISIVELPTEPSANTAGYAGTSPPKGMLVLIAAPLVAGVAVALMIFLLSGGTAGRPSA
jgi:hypothetical protein